jgi:hypothetical protein
VSAARTALEAGLASGWLAPLLPALARVSLVPLPSAGVLDAALGPLIADALGERTVHFEHQDKKRRRGPAAMDALYEARIDRHGRVPTRTHLHDTMNALVWATFPRAKRVLARRQHHALAAQVQGEVVERLPGARTRERDVLAMIDEGGVLLVGHDDGASLADAVERGTLDARIFGHAIYEHLCTREAPVRGFPVRVDVPRDAPSDVVDAALADWLASVDAAALRVPAVVIDPAEPRARVER